MRFKLGKIQENKLFKGESIVIKPSQISEEGKNYFTPGHANKIMRRLAKGRGHKVKLSKADYKHLMSKKMEGAGFRDWFNRMKNKVRDKARVIKRKAVNTVKDVKNLAKGDKNTWKKVGMKSANFVAKKLLDKTPLGGIPVVSGLIEDQIDKGFKKAAEKAGIQGYGKKKKKNQIPIEGQGHPQTPKKISFKQTEGDGIKEDVVDFVKEKGKDFIMKKGNEIKEKGKQYVKKRTTDIMNKKNKVKESVKNYLDNKTADKVEDFKLSLKKLISDLKGGEGLRLSRGDGLYLSRGGNIRNVDLVNPNTVNVNPEVPNFGTDFLPSNHQGMNPISSYMFYGDQMTNSLFNQVAKNSSSNMNLEAGVGTPLNPYIDTSDMGIRF